MEREIKDAFMYMFVLIIHVMHVSVMPAIFLLIDVLDICR